MRTILPTVRRIVFGALACALALPASSDPTPAESALPSASASTPLEPASVRFAPGPPATRSGPIEALAWDPARGRLALGGARGAWLREADGRVQAVLERGAVHALAFDPEGALWIGTDRGLLLRDRDRRLLDRSPGPGDAARAVAALAAAPGVLAAATGDGVHVSIDGRVWQRLAGALPAAPAAALALRPQEGALELWWIARDAIWRARLAREGSGFAVRDVREERPFGGVSHAAPVHLTLGLPGVDIAVVSADTIAWREEPDGAWRTASAEGLPGAAALRIGSAGGRLWLATDRGLLEAPGPQGPWRRAAPPAGGEATSDVVGDGRSVFAATEQGLLEGRLESSVPHPVVDALPLPEPRVGEPSVGDVQRAALVYLDLGPDHVRRLRRGLALRGLLPVVTLDFDRTRGRDARRDWDQSFVSGATRQLLDHGHARSQDAAATLRFSWDLGDVAYHPEEVDLSKEAREVIELRDDVLDEVTQLYFERRRVLLELALLPPASRLEVLRLQLRADELAAQLDAWTGGWFGRHAPPLAR